MAGVSAFPRQFCQSPQHAAAPAHVIPDNLEAGDDALHEAEDYALRDQMTSYRLSFVKIGDPNGGMLDSWPPFTDASDQVMEFDRGSRIAPRPQPEQVDFCMRYSGPGA